MADGIVERYLGEVQAAIAAIDHDSIVAVADVLMAAWDRGATVYTLSNGGSASLASHMACDLAKNASADLGRGAAVRALRRLKVVALTDNSALLTALGNDINFGDIYVEQLKILLTADDVVLGVSGSGASANVLGALRYARLIGARTIALTGMRASAAPMIDLADHVVRAPVEMMEQIEDLHLMFNHVLTVVVRERIRVAAT